VPTFRTRLLSQFFWGLCSTIVLNAEQGYANFTIRPTIKYADHFKYWEQDKDFPFIVQIQEGTYDNAQEILDILGTCTLRKGHAQLQCQKLHYDQKKNTIWVWDGSLKDASGDHVYFDRGILSQDLNSGTLHNVRILTHLRERITARKLVKSSADKIHGERVAYTSCQSCKDSLSEPLWSLHGAVIEQDSTQEETEYRDATLKFKGVPIAYAPYFYLPTKPRSGLLAPYVGSNVGAGVYTGTPYYWHISPSQDMKVTPFYMTQGGEMLASQYRKRFYQGELSFSAAGNATSKEQARHQMRGYGALDLKVHVSPQWRLNMQEYIVSDRTFFTTRPFFGFTSAPYLESKSALEAFYPKHWFSLRSLRYQDLSPEYYMTESSCAVAPEMQYAYTSALPVKDTFTRIKTGTASLYRKEGTQMQRANADASLEHRITKHYGGTVHTSLHLGQAMYSAQIYPAPVGLQKRFLNYTPYIQSPTPLASANFSQSIRTQYYRIFPEAQSTFSWPLASRRWIITPTLQGLASPSHINSWRIPNQDSQNFQFHDGNLFAKSRFPGIDRVDDGSRINYAVHGQYAMGTTQHVEAYIGQRYSISRPAQELSLVGVRKGFSDIVGRISWKGSYTKLLYRFRERAHPWTSQVHMLGGSLGTPVLECSGSYMFFAADPTREVLTHQTTVQLKSNLFTRYWNVRCFVTQNLNRNAMAAHPFEHKTLRPLNQGAGIGYENECFAFDLFVQYSRYQMSRDLKPGISFGLSVHFKPLGEIRTSRQLFSRKPDARQSSGANVAAPKTTERIEAFFPIE
jgi:LPS-assembly protein